MFWTLGGKQVGKAALAGWEYLSVIPAESVRLWPFHGPIAALLDGDPDIAVVTETYPREFYQHFQSGPLDAPKEHEPSNTPRISEEERASIEATLAGLIAVARAVGYTNDDLIELLQRGILRRAD